MMITKAQYEVAMERIDTLLRLVNEDTPTDDKNYIELMLLTDIVEQYEEVHYPISSPSLKDVIKLRMYEMNLTQKAVSQLIGVSPSRVSEYLTGKSEPTLQIARNIAQKLNIDANIILGV